jgi:hypothetical protein
LALLSIPLCRQAKTLHSVGFLSRFPLGTHIFVVDKDMKPQNSRKSRNFAPLLLHSLLRIKTKNKDEEGCIKHSALSAISALGGYRHAQ